MASREAKALVNEFIAYGVDALALAIDELRVRDLEALRDCVVTAFDRMECSKRIAAIKAAIGETDGKA